MKITLARQALIIVLVPLLIEVLFVGTLLHLVKQLDLERAREAHARDVAYNVSYLMRSMLKRGTASLLVKVTKGDPKFVQDYNDELPRIEATVSKISELVKDSEHEQKIFTQISKRKDAFNKTMDLAALFRLKGQRLEAAAFTWQAQQIIADAFRLSDHLVKEQQQQEVEYKEAQARTRAAIIYAVCGLVASSILIAAALSYCFNRSAVQRLNRLKTNILQLSSDEELEAPIPGADEISDLDAAFRSMSVAIRDARAKEQAVLSNAAEVICLLDSEGNFIDANLATKRNWGYDRVDLVGKNLNTIIDPFDRDACADALKTIKQSGRDVEFDCRLYTKIGQRLDTHWALRPVPADSAIACVVRDITAIRNVERLKREFVAMVSHDLRTPLTSIQLAHELFNNGVYGELNDEGLDELDAAHENVERLLQLVNRIIDNDKTEQTYLTIRESPES